MVQQHNEVVTFREKQILQKSIGETLRMMMKLMIFSTVIFSDPVSGEDDLTGPRDPSTKVRDIHQDRGARVRGAARRPPAGGGDQPGADHGAGAEGAHARPQAPSSGLLRPGPRQTRS